MGQMPKFMTEIQKHIERRPVQIDKLERLWDAAVLVPLIETNQGVSIVFEVRAAGLGWQPGDICFPGGRYECSDKNFSKTAIRETCEELGISNEDIQLAGALDYLVTDLGPIIHPFVGWVNKNATINCNKDEVAEVFSVPVKYLLDYQPRCACMELANKATDDFPFELLPNHTRDWNKRRGYKVYFYEYQGHVIWGLTARILYGFLKRFNTELAVLQIEQ